MEKTIYYGEMDTPIGKILVNGIGNQVIRIDYGTFADMRDMLESWGKRYIGNVTFVEEPYQVQPAIEQLHEYFFGSKKQFSINLKIYGTPFQKKVWQALFDYIPFGESKSYKDIAEAIGNPKAVRAVGGAVNKNPFSIIVPCHRVIGANGQLVGYNGGLDKKEFLLKHESIIL